MDEIRTIAFDLGGVFFTEGKIVATESLFQKYGYDKEIILELFDSPQNRDWHRGLISDEEFWSWVQSKLPQGYDAGIIKQEYYDGYTLDEDVFNLVKKLRNKYKLVVFSGNIKSRVEYLDRKYGFRRYFNFEIYSYDHHFDKGDKEFQDVLLQETGNKPGEIAYIDDGEKPINFAKELGINAILYKPGEIKELEKALYNLGVRW